MFVRTKLTLWVSCANKLDVDSRLLGSPAFRAGWIQEGRLHKAELGMNGTLRTLTRGPKHRQFARVIKQGDSPLQRAPVRVNDERSKLGTPQGLLDEPLLGLLLTVSPST